MRQTIFFLLAIFFLAMSLTGCVSMEGVKGAFDFSDPSKEYGLAYQEKRNRERLAEGQKISEEMCQKYYPEMKLKACLNLPSDPIVRVRIVTDSGK